MIGIGKVPFCGIFGSYGFCVKREESGSVGQQGLHPVLVVLEYYTFCNLEEAKCLQIGVNHE